MKSYRSRDQILFIVPRFVDQPIVLIYNAMYLALGLCSQVSIT